MLFCWHPIKGSHGQNEWSWHPRWIWGQVWTLSACSLDMPGNDDIVHVSHSYRAITLLTYNSACQFKLKKRKSVFGFIRKQFEWKVCLFSFDTLLYSIHYVFNKGIRATTSLNQQLSSLIFRNVHRIQVQSSHRLGNDQNQVLTRLEDIPSGQDLHFIALVLDKTELYMNPQRSHA